MNDQTPDVDPDGNGPASPGAMRQAMDRLARREWSRAGLRDALIRAGIDEDDAAAAVDVCVTRGWLDERTAAARRAERLVRRGGADPAWVAAQLEGQGVAGDVAREVAADAVPDALAAAIAEAESARRPGADPERERRRIAGRLARRGFEEDVVHEALRRAGLPSEDPDAIA